MHDTPTTQTTDRPTALEKLAQPEGSNIKRVIAVMSGKGGVGKSSVSALLASALARRGHKTALLDADITGPSIPKLFGLKTLPSPVDSKLLPAKSSLGISVMSLNFLLENEDDPVIWRGPLIAGAVKQFWTDVIWGEVDYMVVDLPPGTGDVPLTALQSLPLDGVVIVSTPQDLAAMVVRKAVNMVRMLKVPVLGLIENMAWVSCPNCDEKIEPFGSSKLSAMAANMETNGLASLPLDPQISQLGDKGKIEEYQGDLSDLVSIIETVLPV